MTRPSSPLIAGVTVSALAAAAPAAADCVDGAGIVGHGRAANPLNYDPPRHYDMVARARAAAVAAWVARIEESCRHAIPDWRRATSRRLDCEGYGRRRMHRRGPPHASPRPMTRPHNEKGRRSGRPTTFFHRYL